MSEPGGTALVVFDMAGTTVHDGGEVVGAFADALADHGVTVTADELAAVRGASKRWAVRRFFPEGADGDRQADSAYAAFRAHLRARYGGGGARAMDGAEAVFEALRAAGIRVALNTGFDREITALLMAALGWERGKVDALVCGDDVTAGRPAPYMIFRAMELTGTASVHEVASVGDTELDLLAGHNAGTRWNIGVLSGAHDAARLARAPHTHLADSIASLPAFRAAGR